MELSITAMLSSSFVLLVGFLARLVESGLQPRTNNGPAILGCDRLASQFPGSVLWPGTNDYQNNSTAIFSNTCILSPNCVFEPSFASEISKAIKIIKKTASHFSILSGGHMPVPGAQSVQPGVMISLTRLNGQEFKQDLSIASIGPGQVWRDVYQWLAKYGLAVNGGRYPTVGVGGLLVGGGISYFSSKHGWSCDTVVAYEVVLADGTIVEATAAGAYADLFWALRGGHNNFGIVTRFDLKTFPMTSAYYGGTVWDGKNASAQTQFFSALDAYMLPGGGVDNPSVATSAIVSVTPGSGLSQLISIRFAPGNEENPMAFENFTAIDGPVIQDIGGKVVPDWTKVLDSLEQTGTRGSRRLFWSVSFKADSRAIRIANETVVGLAFSELANAPGAVVALTYQPISRDWLLASQRGGGNVLDLDPDSGTFIAALISCTWDNAADDEKVNSFAAKAASLIIDQTTELGLNYDFIYLNDAGPNQKPFESYGGGSSLPRLIRIRDKYDPAGFLRDYLSHGFELE